MGAGEDNGSACNKGSRCLLPGPPPATMPMPPPPPPPSLPVVHGFQRMTGVISPFRGDNTEANRPHTDSGRAERVPHQPYTQI